MTSNTVPCDRVLRRDVKSRKQDDNTGCIICGLTLADSATQYCGGGYCRYGIKNRNTKAKRKQNKRKHNTERVPVPRRRIHSGDFNNIKVSTVLDSDDSNNETVEQRTRSQTQTQTTSKSRALRHHPDDEFVDRANNRRRQKSPEPYNRNSGSDDDTPDYDPSKPDDADDDNADDDNAATDAADEADESNSSGVERSSDDIEKVFIENQYDPKHQGIKNRKQRMMLGRLKQIHDESMPTLNHILSLNTSDNIAAEIMELYVILKNTPVMSTEHLDLRAKIMRKIIDARNMQSRHHGATVAAAQYQLCTRGEIIDSKLPQKLKLETLREFDAAEALNDHEKLAVDIKIRKCIDTYQKMLPDQIQLRNEMELLSTDDIYERKLVSQRQYFTKQVFENILQEYALLKAKTDESETIKIRRWLDYVTTLPHHVKQFPVTSLSTPEQMIAFEQSVIAKLNKWIYGQQELKDYMRDFIHALITNPNIKRKLISLESPPGMGKSSIAQALADCLEVPCITIHMGGQNDISVIKGHSKTYISAVPGMLIHKLCTACDGIASPVVFLDEIDKTSSRNGEIEGALCEILDPDSNHKFEDYYMGFPYDLSNCIFVTASNDMSKVSHIVSDRLQSLKLKQYTTADKVSMATSHLVPKILSNIFADKVHPFIFTAEACSAVLSESRSKEKGVRQYIRNLETICKRLNRMRNLGVEYFAPKDESPQQVNENQQLVVTAEIAKKLFWEPEDLSNINMSGLYI